MTIIMDVEVKYLSQIIQTTKHDFVRQFMKQQFQTSKEPM